MQGGAKQQRLQINEGGGHMPGAQEAPPLQLARPAARTSLLPTVSAHALCAQICAHEGAQRGRHGDSSGRGALVRLMLRGKQLGNTQLGAAESGGQRRQLLKRSAASL